MGNHNRHHLRAARRQSGFALIAVLGLLSVLSLVATFIADYAEQRAQQSVLLRQQLQARLDEQATLATLLHIVATRPLLTNAYALQPGATTATDASRSV